MTQGIAGPNMEAGHVCNGIVLYLNCYDTEWLGHCVHGGTLCDKKLEE